MGASLQSLMRRASLLTPSKRSCGRQGGSAAGPGGLELGRRQDVGHACAVWRDSLLGLGRGGGAHDHLVDGERAAAIIVQERREGLELRRHAAELAETCSARLNRNNRYSRSGKHKPCATATGAAPHLLEVQLLQFADAERPGARAELRGGSERSAHRRARTICSGAAQKRERTERCGAATRDAARSFVNAAAAVPHTGRRRTPKTRCRIFRLGHGTERPGEGAHQPTPQPASSSSSLAAPRIEEHQHASRAWGQSFDERGLIYSVHALLEQLTPTCEVTSRVGQTVTKRGWPSATSATPSFSIVRTAGGTGTPGRTPRRGCTHARREGAPRRAVFDWSTVIVTVRRHRHVRHDLTTSTRTQRPNSAEPEA